MFSSDVIVANELGLHARPAAQIAMRADRAKSDIWIISGNEKADARSVIDILLLSCRKGSLITVKAENRFDLDILNDIKLIIENKCFITPQNPASPFSQNHPIEFTQTVHQPQPSYISENLKQRKS
jgi:phosphocarrier protein